MHLSPRFGILWTIEGVILSKVGVIGSSGLLGKAITRVMTRNCPESVVEFTRSRNSSYSSKTTNLVLLDILKFEQSLKSLKGLETIFFCNGYGGIDYASEEADLCFNSEKRLIEKLLDLDKRIIYFSSNKVCLLQDPANIVLPPSLHPYLQHKRSIEMLLRRYPNQTIIRLGKVIHDDFPRYQSWIKDCTNSRSIYIPENAYYEPVDINFVSEKTFKIYKQDLSGPFIMQSSDAISYFTSARIVIQTFFDTSMYNHLINPVDLEIPLPAITLDSVYNLGDFLALKGSTSARVIEMVAKKMRSTKHAIFPSPERK